MRVIAPATREESSRADVRSMTRDRPEQPFSMACGNGRIGAVKRN